MKTVLVVYTNTKLADTSKIKRYAFNSNDDLKVGDMIDSPNYDTPMQVVAVLDEAFKYYNTSNGDLTNKVISTRSYDVRELKIREEDSNAVYGSIISNED